MLFNQYHEEAGTPDFSTSTGSPRLSQFPKNVRLGMLFPRIDRSLEFYRYGKLSSTQLANVLPSTYHVAILPLDFLTIFLSVSLHFSSPLRMRPAPQNFSCVSPQQLAISPFWKSGADHKTSAEGGAA